MHSMLLQFLSETGGWGEKRGTSKSSEGKKKTLVGRGRVKVGHGERDRWGMHN